MNSASSRKIAALLALITITLSGCASLTSAYESASKEVSSWFSSSDHQDNKDKK